MVTLSDLRETSCRKSHGPQLKSHDTGKASKVTDLLNEASYARKIPKRFLHDLQGVFIGTITVSSDSIDNVTVITYQSSLAGTLLPSVLRMLQVQFISNGL